MNVKFIFTPVLLICVVFNVFSHNSIVRFQNYSSEEGLSHSIVSSIVEDDLGFLWFGTQDGLNKFDGYTFKTYYSGTDNLTPSYDWIKMLYKDSFGQIWIIYNIEGIGRFDPYLERFYNYVNDPNDPHSISGNFTHRVTNFSYVFEDSERNVWIATESGLNRYDREKDQFDVMLPVLNTKSGISASPVTFMAEDDRKLIWIGTLNGLLYYDMLKDEFQPFTGNPANDQILNDTLISYILTGKEGSLWVGTSHSGLNYIKNPLDAKKVQVEHYITDPLNKNFEPTIFKIYETRNNHLLVGTRSGLYLMKRAGNSFTPQLMEVTRGIPVYQIYEDIHGYIWVSSQGRGTGIMRFTPDITDYEVFTKNELVKYSFTSQKVNCITETSTGTLWIGTEKDGVYCLDLFSKNFRFIDDNPHRTLNLNNNEVYSIHQDSLENLWVGTKGGLNKLSLKTGQSKIFQKEGGFITGIDYRYSKNISGNLVGTIAETKDHKLWLGYFDYKVSLFDPVSEVFLNFEHNEKNPGSFLIWSLRSICVTNKGDIYFGGTRNELCKLNDDGLSFTYFPINPPNNRGTNSEWITCIREDHENNIWIGTIAGGLIKQDPVTGKFDYHTHRQNHNSPIPANHVRCIHIPALPNDSILWIGTNAGLVSFNKKRMKSESITTRNGLPSNIVHGLLEDDYGKIWISTNKGLSSYDPENQIIRTYTIEDGLQGNEFNEGAYFKGKDGTLYFGGRNGITYFKPGEIKDNPFDPKVVITGFKLFNKPLKAGDTIDQRVLLSQTISNTNELFLNYREKILSVEFANLNFVSPNKIKYRYKLDGFETGWNEVDASHRFANYTNLPSGDYTFMVISTNSDGKWSNTPTTLNIHIKPPFWETAWFKGIVSAFILVLFIVIVSIRTHTLKAQKRKLEQEVTDRTKDLREANMLLQNKQEEILRQSSKIESQRDNLREQNIQLENQKSEIREMAEKLHAQDEEKLKFFTNISHEFRTPLTLMLAPTEKLLQQKDFQDVSNLKKDLSLIFKSQKQLLKLINQLLDVRKVETGNLKLKVSKNDIVPFIHSLYQLFIPFAEKKNILFNFNHPQFPSLKIYFDPDKIEKILYNLLSNAFKHTPAGGKVILSLNGSMLNETRMLKITVTDTGTGIAEEHLPYIFDRFYQMANKHTSGRLGSGLGLSIARDMAEVHHGSIQVKSVLNEGTAFEVYLPLESKVYNDTEIENEAPEEYLFEETKSVLEDAGHQPSYDMHVTTLADDDFVLLVVEDNPDMQHFLHKELKYRYNVIVAANGEEGLRVAREELPDLIISDIMMPKMDGLTLCRELKSDELTSHIPVFLLTAKSEVEHQLAGFEEGADDYITKPFSIEVLHHKIRNILSMRKLLADKFKAANSYIPENIRISKLDQGFLERFVKLVEKNIDDSELSGDRLAAEMGMSKGNLYKKLKTLNGMSVNIYIRTIRLKVAARLLKEGDYSISDVAYAVGFQNPKYFSTCFSELFEMSPKEYMHKSA